MLGDGTEGRWMRDKGEGKKEGDKEIEVRLPMTADSLLGLNYYPLALQHQQSELRSPRKSELDSHPSLTPPIALALHLCHVTALTSVPSLSMPEL